MSLRIAVLVGLVSALAMAGCTGSLVYLPKDRLFLTTKTSGEPIACRPNVGVGARCFVVDTPSPDSDYPWDVRAPKQP